MQSTLAKPCSHRRFLGETYYHTTPFVGQTDATVEIGTVGKGGDTVGDIA